MAFISEFIGKPVVDLDGDRIGSLTDLVARFQKDLPHPIIVAIMVKSSKGPMSISSSDLKTLIPLAITLRIPEKDVHPYIPDDQDFYLVEDVLDKQIIDTDDIRVVRANDLELIRVNDSLLVSNVDVGIAGILRRVGLEKPLKNLAKIVGRNVSQKFVSLDDVKLLPHEHSLQLNIPGEALSSLHPADLADLISDLNRPEGNELLKTLDVKTLADTIEEVETDFQVSLVREMSDEKVADILEEMNPDDAADLLGELPKERSEDLLKLMDTEEAMDVRKLLEFPVDSAGGIMTTDYAVVHMDLTAEQVIIYLRETMEEAETIFYVYVTGKDGNLTGVFSLAELIRAQPAKKVTDFMHKRVVSVHLLDEQKKVAQVVAKYNLLAVPVVDHHNILHGIVTADDALDQIIPTAWKKRLPRMYH